MNTLRFSVPFITLVFSSLVGCAAGAPLPEPAAPNTPPGEQREATSATPGSAKPDTALARRHFLEHVKYPATRTQILEACAQTTEFTADEKHWFESNLPEGEYASAEQVLGALKL